MNVDVFSFANWRHDLTDVLTVFNDGIAHGEVVKCDFVSEGHFLPDDTLKLAIVLRHHAQQIHSGNEILNDHDADIIATIMDKQMRLILHSFLGVLSQASYKI
jgi:hypothetical protein